MFRWRGFCKRTSLYYWLYHAIFRESQPPTLPTWIQRCRLPWILLCSIFKIYPYAIYVESHFMSPKTSTEYSTYQVQYQYDTSTDKPAQSKWCSQCIWCKIWWTVSSQFPRNKGPESPKESIGKASPLGTGIPESSWGNVILQIDQTFCWSRTWP